MTENKTDQPQIDKFRDLARQVEADEDEARFEATVRKVAKGEGSPSEEPSKA